MSNSSRRFAALHPSLSWRLAISASSLRNAFSHSDLCSQPCIYLNVSSCLSLFNPLMALLPLQPLCSILQPAAPQEEELMECEILGFVPRSSQMSQTNVRRKNSWFLIFICLEKTYKTASVQAARSQLHSFLANQIAAILGVIRPSRTDSTTSCSRWRGGC